MFDNLFKSSKNSTKVGFNEPFTPDTEITYKFKGGLVLLKTGDGHKRPMIGGPTKGWINIGVKYKECNEELVLYAEGTQGEVPEEYAPVKWKGFAFAQAGEGKIVVSTEK